VTEVTSHFRIFAQEGGAGADRLHFTLSLPAAKKWLTRGFANFVPGLVCPTGSDQVFEIDHLRKRGQLSAQSPGPFRHVDSAIGKVSVADTGLSRGQSVALVGGF
jgi:hypothetical protein